MANKQPQIVTIDGVEYNAEDFTQDQAALVHHVADLDRKLASIDFQRVQMQVGRDAFFAMLKQALVKSEETTEQ